MPAASLDQVVNLAKRRGFIVQSSEIYGGAAAAYDYGPLGVEIKNAVKRLWWEEMTRRHENIIGLDAAIFMHPTVWEASGHVQSFSDELVECRSCHRRYRLDDLQAREKDDTEGKHAKKDSELECPNCRAKGQFTSPRKFNLMFLTHLGPAVDDRSVVYLRPETAQGMYVNALYLQQTMRMKVPFGIAQIGKAFRNEITPGQFTFRTVEFEQAEMQFLVRPSEAERWYMVWRDERMYWYYDILEFPPGSLRIHEHEKTELAHYAQAASDVQFHFPFGWKEVEGVHNRGDWDLLRHQEYSGKDLSFYDDASKRKFLPWIIETSVGIDRIVLALLCQAYTEEELKPPTSLKLRGAGRRGERTEDDTRLVLKLPRAVAPIQVAVFPLLSNHEAMVAEARAVTQQLRSKFRVQYDDGGAIGRRYRRQDEIGTPVCVTIDHQTLDDDTVTVRDRDSMDQERVKISELEKWLG